MESYLEFTLRSLDLKCSTVIENVSLTAREQDIIAGLLFKKTSKGVSSLLSIKARTVETHIYNIMLKVGCNSREGIIEFIEASEGFEKLKRRYECLLKNSKTRQIIQTLANLKNKTLNCTFVYCEGDYLAEHECQKLEKNLKLIGVDTQFSAKAQKLNFKNLPLLEDRVLKESTSLIVYAYSPSSLEEPKEEALIKFAFVPIAIKKHEIKAEEDLGGQHQDRVLDATEALCLILEQLLPEYDWQQHLKPAVTKAREYFNNYEKLPGEGPSGHSLAAPSRMLKSNKISPSFFASSFIRKGRFSWGRGLLVLVTLLSSLSIIAKFSWFLGDQSSKGQITRSNILLPNSSVLLNRPQLINEIENKLRSPGIQAAILVGVGGSGKTTLARSYIRSQKNHLIWEINAENKAALLASYEYLICALSKTPAEQEQLKIIQLDENSVHREKRVLEAVKMLLRKQGEWLLLYDNVESFSQIRDFFPFDEEIWGGGKIIITTRDKNIGNNVYLNNSNVIMVPELSRKEKETLFKNIVFGGKEPQRDSIPNKKIDLFLDEISPFPLDVSTAAYYIKGTQVSFDEYIKRLEKTSLDFDITQAAFLKEVSEYTKTRYGIITLTLNSLIKKNHDFSELIFLISLLDSQNIPYDLIAPHKDNIVCDQLIRELKKHSLIASETSPYGQYFPVLSVHRSTQEITLKYIKVNLNEKESYLQLFNVTESFIKYLHNVSLEHDHKTMKLMVTHTQEFLKKRELWKSSDKLFNAQTITLLKKYGRLHRLLGDIEKTKEVLLEGYNLSEIEHGSEHIITSEMLADLGQAYLHAGAYLEAQGIFEKALPIYIKHYGRNHVETARLLAFLSHTARDLGHFLKAKQLLEESVAIQRKQGLQGTSQMAGTLGELGDIYRILGDYKTAEVLLDENHAWHKKKYGNDHARTAWSMVNIANVKLCLKNFESAKELLEASLALHKKYYGENHIRAGWASAYLGKAYIGLGKYEKAQEFLDKSLKIHIASYGKGHIRLAKIYMSLGQVSLQKGDFVKAQELLQTSLTIYQNNQHPETYMTLEAMAELYIRQAEKTIQEGEVKVSEGYNKKAVDYLNQAASTIKLHFPPDSLHLVKISDKLKTLGVR